MACMQRLEDNLGKSGLSYGSQRLNSVLRSGSRKLYLRHFINFHNIILNIKYKPHVANGMITLEFYSLDIMIVTVNFN